MGVGGPNWPLVGRGELAGLLQRHLGLATDYHPFAALGAEYAAAALLAGIAFSQLVSHGMILSGLWRPGAEAPIRLPFQLHLLAAADNATGASLSHNKLGAALRANITFAGLVGQFDRPLMGQAPRITQVL